LSTLYTKKKKEGVSSKKGSSPVFKSGEGRRDRRSSKKKKRQMTLREGEGKRTALNLRKKSFPSLSIREQRKPHP